MWSLFTRMEDRVHSYFPRSHEATNHFQISMPNMVLEDDIVGEADSPIRLSCCNGSLLYRCTVFADMSWWLAVDRWVRGRRAFVSRGVSRWSVGRWRVLCRAVVTRGVGARRILLRSVMGSGVVCWGVCSLPCVLRHKVLTAVLHYCYNYTSASSAAPSLGGGAGEMWGEKKSPKKPIPQYRQDPQCKNDLLSSVDFPHSSRNSSQSFLNTLSLTFSRLPMQILHNASQISFFTTQLSLSSLVHVWLCLVLSHFGFSSDCMFWGRALYILWQAILGT